MSEDRKVPPVSIASSVASAAKSEAGLIWSRLSSYFTAAILAILIAVGGFAFNRILSDQSAVNDKFDARLGAVETVLPAIQSQLSVQQTTIGIFHQDTVDNSNEIKDGMRDLKHQLEAHTDTLSNINSNLSALTATLDVIKQRSSSSSISQLGNRLPDLSHGLPPIR